MLAAGSVHVSIVSPASFVHIDSATVDALELVKPLRAAKQRTKATTLYNLLNHTKTACGATLLRVRIHLVITARTAWVLCGVGTLLVCAVSCAASAVMWCSS